MSTEQQVTSVANLHENLAVELQVSGSESQALANIAAWSTDSPKWQRDALRRLCTKETLDETDLEELTALCKNMGKGSVPLSIEDVPDPESATAVVNLKAIHSTENVNALKPGERLTFDKVGLTVVYGDNGSGKSGYVRILRKVCRARVAPKDDKIQPNIYATKTGPQKAIIDFIANGQNKSEEWTTGNSGDPLLSSVSVFDCRTANVHVDEANDVAYTPFPMLVLELLAEASREIKKRITKEIDDLDQHTPETIANPKCHEGTEVHKLIAVLDGKTKEDKVRELAKLSDKENARLIALRTDLSNDPAKMAGKVKALKLRLDTFTTKFKAFQKAVSDENITQLTKLYQDYRIAQDAAIVAADKLFADEPLPHVGSDIWRALWEAARRYSENRTYPGIPFPFTEDDARCVLCQQKLDPDAVVRLKRFESFVENETKKNEEQAKIIYERAFDELINADVPAVQIPDIFALIKDELNDDDLANSVRTSAISLKWRLRAIKRDSDNFKEVASFPSAYAWPTEALTNHSAALSDRFSALRAEDESEERNQLRIEFEELADREWLSLIQEDVVAEIGRRKIRAALSKVLKDTATNRITIKSDEIAEQLVTNMLRSQFSTEIEKLGNFRLAIELRKETARYGVPRFQVRLIQKPDISVGEILSEGEYRCVALAAFLAELATIESRSAIVFDDPVSSLDHLHREEIAKRLAVEGENRQVIVFTHDIAFLFLLDQACRDIDTHVAFRSVTSNDDFTGFVQHDPPIRAQPVEKVITSMQRQLDNEKIHYANGDHGKWETTVDALQKRLRWAWERAVEEAVGVVLKRLSNKVQTEGLAKVTALTMDDCIVMRQAYGRCSTLMHSSADALNPPLPKPEKVQFEITELRNWVINIKMRQEKIDWLQ